MDRAWVFDAAADERRQIANLAADLDDAQLAKPSLCTGWDVKTVLAHLVSVVVDGTATFMWVAVRRGSMDRGINELALRRAREPVPQIVASLHRCADRRMSPPGAGPLDPLADVLVHGGDIRIPLGLPFQPDAERACAAIDFLDGAWRFALVSRGLLNGLRLQGTDVERAWGEGAEIRGPVAALMMVSAGRAALLDTLEGPGVPTLRDRIGARQ